MRVDYKKIHLDQQQKKLIKRTILENPYIPVTPYDRQLYAIADRHTRKLIGGSAYSGKSMLGAVLALQHYEVPYYRCLILRSTYDNVIATGGIVDYLDHWTEPFDYIEHNQSKRCFINHEMMPEFIIHICFWKKTKRNSKVVLIIKSLLMKLQNLKK